jgi:cell division protein FtsW (lipid II flippase)
MKLALIIFLAAYFKKYQKKLSNFKLGFLPFL